MKNTNRILILVLSLLIAAFAVSAVSAQNCVCLDANGVKYPSSAPANSVCYVCGQDGCTPTALTLSYCQPPVREDTPVRQPEVLPQNPNPVPVVQEQVPVQQNDTWDSNPNPVPVVQEQIPVQQNDTWDSDPNPVPVVQEQIPVQQNDIWDSDPNPVPVVQEQVPVQQNDTWDFDPNPVPVVQEQIPVQQNDIWDSDPNPVPVVQEQVPVQQNDTWEDNPVQQPVVMVDNTEQEIELVIWDNSNTNPEYPEQNEISTENNEFNLLTNEAIIPEPEVTKTKLPGEQTVIEPEIIETEEPGEVIVPESVVTETDEPGEVIIPESVVTETDEPGEVIIPEPVVTETDEPGEAIIPEPVVTETAEPGEEITPDPEATETAEPGEEITPDPEATETAEPGEEITPDPEVTETKEPGEEITPDPEVTETAEPGEEITPEPDLNLSPEALEELSQILSEEEISNLDSILTMDWLNANVDQLSQETLVELLALFGISVEEPLNDLLRSGGSLPSVKIEGELTDLLLFSPTGGTVTTSTVPFVWLYAYDGETGPTDVTFLLQLTISTASDTATINTTVSSVSCGSNICTYSADLRAYNNSLVSWTVSGIYKSGGTTVTVPGPAAQSFALKFDKPVPPKPDKKPEVPVLECPYGPYEVRKIGFYWAPSLYSESYTVEWHDNKGHHGSANLSNSDPSCKSGRCVVHLMMPGDGNYAWRVVAKNSKGSTASGEMNFSIRSGVPTPAPYSPSGTISSGSNIAFDWQHVGNGVTDYRIQVVSNSDNSMRMDRWFSVSDIYVGSGECYVRSDLYLPAGSYSWRVQASNGSSTSGWSSWKGFKINGYSGPVVYNYANTIPSCLYPTGTITVTSPNFQWRTVTGAAYYMVKLYDSTGTVLFDRQVASSGNCTGEICTWAPDYKLTKNGNYTWSVSSYGGNNALWSNASGSFSLQGVVQQKPMSFVSPAQNGMLTQDSPVIIWTDPGANTAIFHVEIFSSANKSLFTADLNREQAWCDGQTCSIEFKTIPDAQNYRITITPYSDLNVKGEAISLVFSKGSKMLKLNSPKEGSTVQSRPLFRWSMDSANTNLSYELILTDSANNVTTISPLACGMEGVTCEEGEMFFAPAITLMPGRYTVKLGQINSSAVSQEVHFTVK